MLLRLSQSYSLMEGKGEKKKKGGPFGGGHVGALISTEKKQKPRKGKGKEHRKKVQGILRYFLRRGGKKKEGKKLKEGKRAKSLFRGEGVF